MNAYIAMEKYIVKEEKQFGVGVPVTLSEDVAMGETSRRKGVESYNNWILIDIPGKSFFLDIDKPLKEQSDDVLNVLMNKEFLTSLFVFEAKKLLNNMGKSLEGKDVRTESERIFREFAQEKHDLIMKIPSGLDFFNFVNSKCVTHDKAKSSSLLWNFGIKGCRYSDGTGERFLIFNAQKDIEPLEYRSKILEDSKLNL
ncbi:hypothetical protein [uncultured Treponema sp.]|uniref:hypothetical protein n=1 Tax=uncultured Treponema sp. TaxID=162155 RepID=UPI00261479FF|nr:hypothetical protein [uncultured Treponema sp.]